MLVKEGMDVVLVDEDAALLARENEIEVSAEADPGVERYPAEDGVEERFSGESE